MIFPFFLESTSDWLNSVPKFLSEIANDSQYVYNDSFHEQLAIKLAEFFPKAPSEFIEVINSILTQATDAGKYVLLSILLRTESIWSVLVQDVNFQPLLTELALSPNRIYAKNAAELSKKLEDSLSTLERMKKDLKEKEISEELSPRFEAPISKRDDETEEFLSEDLIEDKILKPSEEKEKEFDKLPPPPPKEISKPSPSGPPPALQPAPTISAPIEASAKKKSIPSSITPVTGVTTASLRTTAEYEADEIHTEEKKPEYKIKKEKVATSVKIKETQTIHTHVHYYSRMNPRKTYPFKVTLSSLAKAIHRERTHLITGEKETESRGEFELDESIKQIIVEPLLSGCLVQPTLQFVNPQAKNLPKELIFYITPLVEPGFRPTNLNGSLFIKDEMGTLLFQMKLPELSVTSGRLSQMTTLFGIIVGGAIPAFDYLFGTNMQSDLVNQLTSHLGSIAESIDMWSIVLGAQASIFAICVIGGFMLWWLKGRAKAAPERSMTIQIPQ